MSIQQPNPVSRDHASVPSGATGQPLVSVCIPVFNCQQYVGQAIESVLAQTCANFELILCDNCSTDGTLAVMEGYHDPRIRLFRNDTNIGASANFNKVLSLATGKYIKFLCADDYLYPTCLERQTAILEAPENESVGMAFCRRDIVGPEGQRLFTWGYGGREGRHRGVDMLKRCVRRGSNIIGEPMCVLFRSALLPRAARFPQEMSWLMDLYFWSPILALGDVYAMRQPQCAFRISHVSWSAQHRRRQAADFWAFIVWLRAQPQYQLNYADYLLGKLSVHGASWLRYLLYQVVFR